MDAPRTDPLHSGTGPSTHPAVERRGPGRIDWIDAARGLAITLVVLLHTQEWLETTGYLGGFWDEFDVLATGVRLPLFFMVSGLLARSRVRGTSWREILSGRVLLLAWVYGAWQVIGSATALAGSHITGDHLTPLRMVLSLLASPVRPRFELWFLWALAVFLVLARAAWKVPPALQIGLTGVVSAWFLAVQPTGNLGWDGAGSMFVFFLIGVHGQDAVIQLARWVTPLRAVPLIVVWSTLAFLVDHDRLDGLVGADLMVRLAGLAAGVAIAVLFCRVPGVQLLRSLGGQTLPVYLAHTPLIVLICWLLHTTQPAVPGPALIPLVAAVSIAGSLLLHRALTAGDGRWPTAMLYRPPTSLVTASLSVPRERRSRFALGRAGRERTGSGDAGDRARSCIGGDLDHQCGFDQ